MKTTSKFSHQFTLAVIALLFVTTGAANLWADGGQWDSRHHYRRDNYGYYDRGHYHHYITYHNHHGYWDNMGPFPIFINVD